MNKWIIITCIYLGLSLFWGSLVWMEEHDLRNPDGSKVYKSWWDCVKCCLMCFWILYVFAFVDFIPCSHTKNQECEQKQLQEN